MRHPLVRAAALAALLGPASRAAAAEGYHLPGDTQRALQQFDEASEQLARARAAMAALDAGEAVTGQAVDWAGAPAALVAAAGALKRSAGPLVPEPDERPLSARELRSCATRADAVAELERRHRALLTGSQRGADARAGLRDRLGAAHAAEEALRYLVRTSSKHAGEPALAEAFTWPWPDLEGPSAAALASYTGELRRYLEKVDRSAAEQRARAAEAAELLASYARAKDCLLAGSWSGTRTQAGAVSGLALQLASTAEVWSGTAVLDGDGVAVKSVTISGSAVIVALVDGHGTLAGTLSADGRALKGTVSTQDGPAPFQLRKQP